MSIDSGDTLNGTITATGGTVYVFDRTGAKSITGTTINVDASHVSDVNVSLTNSAFNLENNTFDECYVGNLIIEEGQSTLKINCDPALQTPKTDLIHIGNMSSGHLVIDKINTNGYDPSKKTNETKEFTILTRAPKADGTYNMDFTLGLSPNLSPSNKIYSVKSYNDSGRTKYPVPDTAFIGEAGTEIRDYGSNITLKMGILSQIDTLYAVNIYDEGDKPREYNITPNAGNTPKTIDEYLDLGETGQGLFTVKGNTTVAANYTIDMHNY